MIACMVILGMVSVASAHSSNGETARVPANSCQVAFVRWETDRGPAAEAALIACIQTHSTSSVTPVTPVIPGGFGIPGTTSFGLSGCGFTFCRPFGLPGGFRVPGSGFGFSFGGEAGRCTVGSGLVSSTPGVVTTGTMYTCEFGATTSVIANCPQGDILVETATAPPTWTCEV